jgi:uncharacterized membrane protein YqaE (UPF0057 family)
MRQVRLLLLLVQSSDKRLNLILASAPQGADTFIIRQKCLSLQQKHYNMSLIRVLLAILFPPLAVLDKGCGSFLIVFILTLCGWVPGVIGALVILNKN